MTRNCVRCRGDLQERRSFTLNGSLHTRWHCPRCGRDGLISESATGTRGVREFGAVFHREGRNFARNPAVESDQLEEGHG